MLALISELAKWSHWEEAALPLAWLREGYGDTSLFDAVFEDHLAVYPVVNALWVLRWYAFTGYAAGEKRAAARIRGYLVEFGGR